MLRRLRLNAFLGNNASLHLTWTSRYLSKKRHNEFGRIEANAKTKTRYVCDGCGGESINFDAVCKFCGNRDT